MRVALKDLFAAGPATKVGRTWVVPVARRDGGFCGLNTVVTFPTKKAAVEFAVEFVMEPHDVALMSGLDTDKPGS
jgi:hypothetical protein